MNIYVTDIHELSYIACKVYNHYSHKSFHKLTIFSLSYVVIKVSMPISDSLIISTFPFLTYAMDFTKSPHLNTLHPLYNSLALY